MKGGEKIVDDIMSEIQPIEASIRREIDVRAGIIEPLFLRQAPTTIARALQID